VIRSQIVWIINLAINVWYILLLVRVIFSWMKPRRPNPILSRIEGIAFAATEPLLRPIRNLLFRFQRGAPIDFSPIVAWLIIEFVRRLLLRALYSL
jgi:YggT family protein